MGLYDVLNAVGQGTKTGLQTYDTLQQRDRQQEIEDQEREERQRLGVIERAIMELDLDNARNPRPTYNVGADGGVSGSGFRDPSAAGAFAGSQPRPRPEAPAPPRITVNRPTAMGDYSATGTPDQIPDVVAGLPPMTAPRPGTGGVPDPSDLRTEFQANPVLKDSLTIAQSYQRLRAVAAQPPTGAGDLAIIFSYMKILDPGSTVREGEFANAENAQGIPNRVRTLYNRALNGERLAPETRAEFVGNVDALVQGQSQALNPVIERYRGFATQGGLSPDDVVYDPFAGMGGGQSQGAQPSGSASAKSPAQARADELRRSGLSPDQIVAKLRLEGLIR